MNHTNRTQRGSEVLYRLLSGEVEVVEDSEFRSLLASGQAAIFVAAIELAAVRLFGPTPNVRDITRYLLSLRESLPSDQAFRAREVEAIVRIVLGELWLAKEIDIERIGYSESRALLAMIKDLRLSVEELSTFVEQAEVASARITKAIAALSEEILAKVNEVRNR